MTTILFVVNGHAYTAKHRLPLLVAARDSGYKVLCIAPEGSDSERLLLNDGWQCFAIRMSRRGVSPLWELSAIYSLVRLYRKLKPDLVHHATIKPVLYGSIAARISRVPAVVNAITGLGYVFTGNDVMASLLRRVVSPLYRIAFSHPNQRVIFQNREDREILVRRSGLPEGCSVLIEGSGVDTDFYVPQPEPPGVLTAVLAARMLWDKGVREFVEAAESLRNAGQMAKFVLVGDLDAGNPSAIPLEWIERQVTNSIVEWWGKIDDMRQVYARSHIVVLPSYREGLPKVLLEAGASGRAVVTVDSPGCRDAVISEATGLVVPVRDSHALAEAMDRLLSDADLRKRLAKEARKVVEKRFSAATVTEQTLTVYRQLVGSTFAEGPFE